MVHHLTLPLLIGVRQIPEHLCLLLLCLQWTVYNSSRLDGCSFKLPSWANTLKKVLIKELEQEFLHHPTCFLSLNMLRAKQFIAVNTLSKKVFKTSIKIKLRNSLAVNCCHCFMLSVLVVFHCSCTENVKLVAFKWFCDCWCCNDKWSF